MIKEMYKNLGIDENVYNFTKIRIKNENEKLQVVLRLFRSSRRGIRSGLRGV